MTHDIGQSPEMAGRGAGQGQHPDSPMQSLVQKLARRVLQTHEASFDSVVMGGAGRASRSIAFLFPADEARPCMIIKVASSRSESALLVRESQVLTDLRVSVPPALGRGIPEVLGLETANGTAALALGMLHGRRMLLPRITGPSTPITRYLLRSYLRRTFGWSSELAVSTACYNCDAGALAAQAQHFLRLVELPFRQERRIKSFAQALAGSRVGWQGGWQHADLTPGNVLSMRFGLRDSLALVDWAHAQNDLEPWFDAAYAPGTIALIALREQGFPSARDAMMTVLAPHAWPGRVLREELQASWQHPLPLGWGVVTTCIQAALRGASMSRGGWHGWRQIAVALLVDDQLRARLDWLAPKW